MLMPEREKAIELAKSLLNPGGNIIFLLTLHDKKYSLVEKVKPLIKYLTTIDFGNITYKKEFFDLVEATDLKV